MACGAGVEQRLGALFGPVINGRGVALGHQMLTHPSAHHARTYPADAGRCGGGFGDRHNFSLVLARHLLFFMAYNG
jgi:hypothetical protein